MLPGFDFTDLNVEKKNVISRIFFSAHGKIYKLTQVLQIVGETDETPKDIEKEEGKNEQETQREKKKEDKQDTKKKTKRAEENEIKRAEENERLDDLEMHAMELEDETYWYGNEKEEDEEDYIREIW